MYLVLIYAYHPGLFGMQYEKLSNLYQTKSYWNIYEGWHVSFITNKWMQISKKISEYLTKRKINKWIVNHGRNQQD